MKSALILITRVFRKNHLGVTGFQPMKRVIAVIRLSALVWIFVPLFPDSTLATQTHGEPEGLIAHQMAHLFFIISMGIFEYSLRQRNLIKRSGWRYLQFAAILFILWNITAMSAHFLDEQVSILQIKAVDAWHLQITTPEGETSLAMLYYFAKLDHLFCLPAMVFLYLGLKKLLQET